MQNENIKNLEPVVEIKNSNQIQEPLTDTTLPTQPQKQRAYSSTNIPLEFEPDDDIDAIMERFNNLSDEEQTQTKREICEYYGDKFSTQRETHRIHTPDFIYITGDKEKDEQKLQNILSRCHGSLAKRPNSTITVQEFKRRFLLEREAHKEFYGSNPYINALNDAMIQSSILDKVQNPDLYNSPETIELAQRLNYKMAYEDPNLKPFQYALNTITPTITTTPTLTDAVVDNENTFDEIKSANESFNIRHNQNSFSFNEIHNPIYINGKLLEQGTSGFEGGYSNRKNDSGGKTNYGIKQESLDEYNNNFHASYKTGKNFPKNVENLEEWQAKVILNEMYARRYNINYIENFKLARIIYDINVNCGQFINKIFISNLEKILNKTYSYTYEKNGKKYKHDKNTIIPEAAQDTHLLSIKETELLANNLLDARMEYYFEITDKNHNNISNLMGWYNRTIEQHSNKISFKQKYKERVLKYIEKYFNFLEDDEKNIYRKKYIKNS